MSKTILTVESAGDMRLLLDETLTEAGFRSCMLTTGSRAWPGSEAAGAVVDVIITDIDAPRLDGVGFIETVRRDARHHATPILILAPDHDCLRKDLARRAGASGWMLKPVNKVKLVDAVRRIAA